jgi:radical SAM protein with 4Fe4S-binding SPASM domain
VLDAAVSLGLRQVTLSGGEPLMSPDFPAFLDYFRSKRVGCSVETNGMLIAEERLAAIRRCCAYCAISLDGVNPETHNAQRRRVDAFEKTIQGIRNLEHIGAHYQLIMSISKMNYGELVPLLDWVRDSLQGCDKFKVNVILPEGRARAMQEQGLLFGPLDLVRIGEEIGELSRRYPFEIMLHVDPVFLSVKNICRHVGCGGNCGYQKGLSILSDGSISICSLGKLVPQYVFGHISDADIVGVWATNPFIRTIREDGYTRLKGICQHCVFRRTCLGGCRALALQVYGDFFGPSPTCQAYYESGHFPQSRISVADAG